MEQRDTARDPIIVTLKVRRISTVRIFGQRQLYHVNFRNRCELAICEYFIHLSIHVYFSETSNKTYATYISTIKIWAICFQQTQGFALEDGCLYNEFWKNPH